MYKFCIPFLLCIAVLSCDDRLDIEPQQAISATTALDDTNGIRSAIVGMYALYASTDYRTGHAILISDFLANTDDLTWTTFCDAELCPIFLKNVATNNLTAEFFWSNAYRVINQANTIEAALSNIGSEEEVAAFAAELRFMRGMVYFELVELFAQPWSTDNPDNQPGVPIVTTPAVITLQDPFISRNTLREVYAFIIDDLYYAKEHLPDQNGFYPTTFCASALLSRIYLNQEKFDSARGEADRVIESGQFELNGSHSEAFNQIFNSPEDIFSFQITSDAGTNHMSQYFSGELEGGRGAIGITDEHVSKYDTADLRQQLFYFDQQSGVRRSAKWIVQPSADGNVSIMRLAEVYLTRAETRFRLGDKDGAAEDINVIRARAGLDPVLPGDLSLDNILHERYLELVFEGHVLRDLKRTRRSVGHLSYDHWSLVFPIPLREINLNNALQQNDGY